MGPDPDDALNPHSRSAADQVFGAKMCTDHGMTPIQVMKSPTRGHPHASRLRPQARDPNPHLHPSRTMPAPASSKSTESSSTPSGARAVASGSCGLPRRSLRGYVAGGSTDPCDVPISYQRPTPFRGKSLSSQQRSTIGSTIMSGIYGRRPAERICRPNRLIVIRRIPSDSCLGQ